MKRLIRSALNRRGRTVTGLLVPAPNLLRDQGVNFLLISEDGEEYQLLQSKKTLKMWNLVETRVELKVRFKDVGGKDKKVTVLTYRCLDDFIDEDDYLLPADDYEFHQQRLDWAM